MKTFDPSLFPDIANAIGLPSPAFIEKDYYAVQLLKIISEIEIPEGKLIFAGGTCLTKAHLPTFRMSEDIDIKFIPTDHFLQQSDSQKRKNRSNLGNSILQIIEKLHLFSVVNKESRSEGRYRCFSINYPKTYSHKSLRPELKLEFTENLLEYFPPIKSSIGSIYSTVTKEEPEIAELKCDHLDLILVEKFVGLLRRTAEAARGYSENEDEALVRHVYDLHLISENKKDFTNIPRFFSVLDIIQALTQQADFQLARNYWKVLKNRLKKEGNESVTKCNRLKLEAQDGKKYITDVANAETLLRLIQSVPSHKAEPIKLWLAKVGYERMQELSDPAISLNRARETWQKQGRSGIIDEESMLVLDELIETKQSYLVRSEK